MEKINFILDQLEKFEKIADQYKEIILSNLVMLSEIPAPTYKEAPRTRFMLDRFMENGLIDCSIDEMDNALGVLPGKQGNENILLAAHLDTFFPRTVDHTVNIHPDKAVGPGIGDNSLGCVALLMLPFFLKELDITLNNNLIFIGSARSLGKGDLEGLRFFLDHYNKPIKAGLCLNGVWLGHLSHSSFGMLRGEIICKIPDEYDWTRFNAVGSIDNMNEIINRIQKISFPRKPKTTIVFGSIEAGTSYNTIPTKATLRFEVRSESEEIVDYLASTIKDLADEMRFQTGAVIRFNEVARRKPGGIPFSHPLNKVARQILDRLEVEPRISPSISELSLIIERKIPALAIGLTQGENMHEMDEAIDITSIATGMAQLIGIILAIDKGLCDENE